jgi:uncharacterized protein
MPLSDRDIHDLQALLDAVPPPLEPLDVSALDGFLAGVVLQPTTVPPARWLPFVIDVDEGRAPPAGFDPARLHALVLRRHAELEAAVAQRQWFDPWVFELAPEDPPSAALVGWVAGFAAAANHFPALLERSDAAVLEPLALLYRHLDPDDLEDADLLLAEIDELEPPADLAEGVEELVRATLLLADVSRPRQAKRASLSAGRRRRPR